MTRFSIVNGYDNVLKNSLILSTEYDFTNSSFVLDYNWNLTNNLQLRPSFNYQKASYSDENYGEGKVGLYGGQKEISSYALSLRGDYNPIENLRIIAAVRADKFDLPDDYFISYQFAATKSFLSDKLIARAVHSRSNSGSFIGNGHINAQVINQIPTQPLPTTVSSSFRGNSDYELPQVTNTEMGFRSKVAKNINVDVTIFHQQLKNTVVLVQTDSTFGIGASGITIETLSQYMNLPLTAQQTGVTLSVNYVASASFMLSPFVTWQKTEVENIPVQFTLDETSSQNIFTGFDDENKNTPSFYGGFYMNYVPVKKLNLNLNSYFFSNHRTFSEYELEAPTTAGEIDSKLILNLKVSYHLFENLALSGNLRNILNADSREHFGTDPMGSLYFVGLSYDLYK